MNSLVLFAAAKSAEVSQPNHVSGFLGIRSRKQNGEIKYEAFPYSVYNRVAQRYMERVHVGDLVVVKGHLSQVRTKIGTTYTEVVVDEFYLVAARPLTATPVVLPAPVVSPTSTDTQADHASLGLTEPSGSDETSIETMITNEVQSFIDKLTPAAEAAFTANSTEIIEMALDEARASMSRMTPSDSCVKRENGDADNSNMDDRRENEAVHGDSSFEVNEQTDEIAGPVTIGTDGE